MPGKIKIDRDGRHLAIVSLPGRFVTIVSIAHHKLFDGRFTLFASIATVTRANVDMGEILDFEFLPLAVADGFNLPDVPSAVALALTLSKADGAPKMSVNAHHHL